VQTYYFDSVEYDHHWSKKFYSDAEAIAYAKANNVVCCYVEEATDVFKIIWEPETSL
jgi:hypothetical protein